MNRASPWVTAYRVGRSWPVVVPPVEGVEACPVLLVAVVVALGNPQGGLSLQAWSPGLRRRTALDPLGSPEIEYILGPYNGEGKEAPPCPQIY